MPSEPRTTLTSGDVMSDNLNLRNAADKANGKLVEVRKENKRLVECDRQRQSDMYAIQDQLATARELLADLRDVALSVADDLETPHHPAINRDRMKANAAYLRAAVDAK